MHVIYDPRHVLHDPATEVQYGVVMPMYEVPARVESIRAALLTDGSFSFTDPAGHGLEPVLAVHHEGLVRFLGEAWGRWRAHGTAADLLLAGDAPVYGLARPPGHHCPRSAFGGYGLFNYSAAASAYLADRVGRVAVLDVDYHHGNGTQQIFYHRADVLYVSLHADPDRAFP